MSRTSRTSDVTSREHDDDDDDDDQEVSFYPSVHERPQVWARGALAPPTLWKCCKVFLCIVVTAKRSVDELFMHYFHNLSSASPPDIHRGPTDPQRGLSSRDT